MKLVKAQGYDVRRIAACNVKLPNGDVLTTTNAITVPITYVPTNKVERVKFYVVDIQ